jgi:hypothetical protein
MAVQLACRALLAVLASAFLALAGAGAARAAVVFDGSPGTAAPPPTLGGYAMTPFPLDSRPVVSAVTSVPTPLGGSVAFTSTVIHARVPTSFLTWSHGYTGDVYFRDGLTVTLSLPSGTKAFYFYANPNNPVTHTITAVAQDGTTSGPITILPTAGVAANYFGFSATGTDTLSSITVTTSVGATGFGVGEFGINIPLPAQLDLFCRQIRDAVPPALAIALCTQVSRAKLFLAAGRPDLARGILATLVTQLNQYATWRLISSSTASTLGARANELRTAIALIAP